MHKQAKFVIWMSIFLSSCLALVAIVSPAPAVSKVEASTQHEQPIKYNQTGPDFSLQALDEALAQRIEEIRIWTEAVAENDRKAAEEAAAAKARTQKRRSSSPSTSTYTDTGDVWACIRHYESDSSGGYAAIGSGHYGAYQFSQSTWDATARRHGRDDLVGVRPDQASAADQDQMARWLQQDSGWSQWSTHAMCGV